MPTFGGKPTSALRKSATGKRFTPSFDSIHLYFQEKEQMDGKGPEFARGLAGGKVDSRAKMKSTSGLKKK